MVEGSMVVGSEDLFTAATMLKLICGCYAGEEF